MCNLCVSDFVSAVDPSQLWLPRNYNRSMKELKQAVGVAEATERCKTVVAGTVSTKDSVKDHPIFKITCRDENRKTFPWLIDGKTMIIINKPKEKTVDIEEEDEIDLTSLTEEERKVLLRQEKAWAVCSYRLQRRLKHFKGLVLNTKKMPPPILLDNNGLMFKLAFNALAGANSDIEGTQLYYDASCRYENRQYDVNILPRDALPMVSEIDPAKIKSTTSVSVLQKSDPQKKESQKETVIKAMVGRAEQQVETIHRNDLPADRQVQLDKCLVQLKRKTAALDHVVWLIEERKTQHPVKPFKGAGKGDFQVIDFDAVGPTGAQLKSTGICHFSNRGVTVAIQKREK